MANLPPAEAASNLKGWLDAAGIEGIGNGWTSATDSHVALVAGFLLVGCVLCAIGGPIWARFTKVERRPSLSRRQFDTSPVPTTWISRSAALTIAGKSSLVSLRVPAETITVGETLVNALMGQNRPKTPGEVWAEELQRKLIRDFEAQQPSGVREGKYGRELLDWWIDEQASRTDP